MGAATDRRELLAFRDMKQIPDELFEIQRRECPEII